MIKRTAIFILLCTSFQVCALSEVPGMTFPTDETRRTLQDSSREIDLLIEERRHQGLINRSHNISPQTVSPALEEAPPCLAITGVYLQGITLLSIRDLNTLSALPDSCITSNNINELSAEITNLYIAKGYITARVQFIPPNSNGELGLNVVEGFIEAIEGGDRWVNSRTLFPNLTNKPLNLNQLDQGLDQANRLRSNKTTLDILPGTVNGGSIIKLYNQHTSPWRITTTTDNYGQKNTGKWINRLSASIDSPLGLSDFISLSGSSTIDKPNTQYNRAYTLLYSIPYGSLTFSGFNSYSQYTSHPHLNLNRVELHGNSQQTGIRTDWVFHRSQSQISTLNTQLIYKDYNNYFNESRIGVSSQTLSIFELGISHLQLIPAGIISLDIGIAQGMPWFSNQTATSHLNTTFTKGKFSANWQQRFKFLDTSYQFNSQFHTQYSRDGLPGVEWLTVTDRNAVRGFSKNVLSGDNGWYLRNTFSHSIPISNASLSLRAGMDIGQTKGYRSQYGKRSSAGLSAGLTLRYQNLFADIEVSRGKLLSHQQPRDSDEPTQLLTRFSYTF
ncbi:XhlB, XhlA hemolysin secretion/activation protein (TpsB) [Xenorhabdus nematophila ATCC 19061]|uniref:XhlB, XhlA hemolysin secretion/activation protein (TpsB) n=2 Tax=Xenorhabdus nematophila TaxID=628 RepID=D3VFR1_XENNA|nr:ShlB/FhaC/HecB family hemolysin secretion/activation protein [Xenorhabdus nematophila]AAV33650.1 XhlB [Xenorhabdus nematophila]CBJ92577.1 XhlB, XhlA hemolysin secretion/activation protein (TpsB) [Xenorhabdus nematophila ATCC 19061]CEK25389.1 XhlB, XhlA hemolysin secretion/activation protein (TpsB) [Xenorhabdus nematophila AN6/1]